MEVLQGEQSGTGRSRRRFDSLRLAENRALDWGQQESDIDLMVESLDALDGILNRDDGGSLDLLTTGESVESVPNDAGRGVLLTRHDAPDLLRRCKRILVENALIKDKGDRQLYLAVGFISWPHTRRNQQRQRAPLLLFPALLVRIPEQQRYEIRLPGDSAEYNRALAQHVEQRHGACLPEYDSAQPLSTFFAAVRTAIEGLPSLTLDQQMVLGSAALAHGQPTDWHGLRLPDVPAHFDVPLAMSITGNKSLEQLTAVLHLIPDYSRPPAATQIDDSRDPDSADATPAGVSANNVAGLRKYAARLAAEGLDHVEFRQLGRLPDRIGKWSRSVNKGLESHCIQQLLRLPEISARELVRLSGIIELIDKAPVGIEQFAHGDLCFATTTALLRRAQHQARLIEDEMNALQEHFILDRVPGMSQLLSLMSELGDGIEHGPELVQADYFNARRQFMEFSLDKPAQLTREHRRHLQQLAKVLRFRELFVNNTEYRMALGPGYRGLRTEWEQLGLAVEYARELATVLGSETIASQILRNWKPFRARYSAELTTLVAAGEACRRLLRTVGTRWQSQSVTALLQHAQLIASRLREWRSNHGAVENHADKTPAMVLSSFSGHKLDDMVIENQVDETRERIDRLLQDGEIRLEQIRDTLSWLMVASQKANEGSLDIDAIVEHLQIA